MNRKNIIAAAAEALLFYVPCTGCGNDSGARTDLAVCNSYITEKQSLKNIVNASGTVEGSESFSVTSDLNMKVSKIYVSVGSVVNEGDILCEFDSSELRKQLDALNYEISVTSKKYQNEHSAHLMDLELAKENKDIELRIAQRNIDEAVARKDYIHARYDELGSRKNELANTLESYKQQMAGSPETDGLTALYSSTELEYRNVCEEYDKIASSLIEYDNDVANARDNYRRTELECDNKIKKAQYAVDSDSGLQETESKNKVEMLEKKISQCTVTAPKDGIVTSLFVKEGSIANTDSLMTISDDRSLVINATVYEMDILKIFEGQSCEISVIANSEKTYSGKIESVIKIRDDMSQDSTVYSVRISIDNVDDSVIIGMSTQINIITEKRDDVIAVPYDAVFTDSDGKEYVFVGVRSDDGVYIAKKRSVKSGMETSYLSEINGEISEDENVLFPVTGLYDGKNVSIKDTFTSDTYGN